MYFPISLQITQISTSTSRSFPELHSFLLCQSPIEIYWKLFLPIHLFTTQHKSLTVTCFQTALFSDSLISPRVFKRAYYAFTLCQRRSRSSKSGWRKWEHVVSIGVIYNKHGLYMEHVPLLYLRTWAAGWAPSHLVASVLPLPVCCLCHNPEQCKVKWNDSNYFYYFFKDVSINIFW